MYETIYQPSNQNAPRKRTRGRGRDLTIRSWSKPEPEFWTSFVKQYWEQHPLVIRQPFTKPLATPEEMFSAIKNASEQFRTTRPDRFFRFYTEEGFLLTSLKLVQYLPDAGDVSASAYADRITAKLNGQRFGLVINQFQARDAMVSQRMKKLLSGLLAQLPGQPMVEMVSFLGNYDKTPFGIHQDALSVFLFVIEGRKKIYLWPRDYFSGLDDPRLESDFATLHRDAIALEAEAGDIMFWPANIWHVGESVSGLSSTISIALGPLNPTRDVWKLLLTEIEERIGLTTEVAKSPTTPSEAQKRTGLISKISKLAVKKLRKTSRDPKVTRSLKILWLNRMTGAWNDHVLAPLPWKVLTDDVVVQSQPEGPILWLPAGDHDIVCSANGHSFFIPADPKVIKMFKRLNNGDALLVGDLIEEHTGTSVRHGVKFNASAEGIRTVLSKLYSLRAISEPEPDSKLTRL